jgi:hypothetical protein
MLSFLDPLEHSASASITASESYFRGIANFDDIILVGDSAGGINAVVDAGGKRKFSVDERVETTDSPIACVTTDSVHVVAGTEAGDVACFPCTAFKTSSSDRKKEIILGFGFSATSCCARDGIAVVAYSNGTIRAFCLCRSKGEGIALVAEIAAHSKCINAVALNNFSSRLSVASCAEDHIVRVWELQNLSDCARSARGNAELRITFEEKCDSKIFTGICFSSKESLIAATYDDDYITVLKLP